MKKIVEPLLQWYQQNKRILPWRIDKNPYHVWISEIMLQQTRIEAVKVYYQKFIEDIPTISALAQISEDKLLKYWEGLGYYTRARNLKKAACQIVTQYNGIFPSTYKDILTLPGIGEYTAGAISSICFSLPEVAIDGNVLRVVMRLMNCDDNIDSPATKKMVAAKLKEIIPDNSGDFNEGLMELGERICLPNTMPLCEQCPLSSFCKAYQHHTMMDLPKRNLKKEKRIEHRTILIYQYNQEIAIQKRTAKGLLHNLWEFPSIEGHYSKQQVEKYLKEKNINYKQVIEYVQYEHVFTHIVWKISSYLILVKDKDSKHLWCTTTQLQHEYALPTAFQPILKQYIKEESYGIYQSKKRTTGQ